ncbi:MAG: hypothetical protein ACJ789_05580 [Thermomicrobiales bacterium]
MIRVARLSPIGLRSLVVVSFLLLSPLLAVAPQVKAVPNVAPGVVSILINKHGCPGDFDAYNADFNGLAANCHDTLNGVLFELSNATDDVVTHTGDVQASMAIWDPIHEGDETINEQVTSGYGGVPRVMCQIDQSGFFELTPTGSAVGFQITQHVDAGHTLYCDWFNIPYYAGTTVLIRKATCPAGFDGANANIYDLSANCHDIPSGIGFTLTDSANTPHNGTTDQTGWVQWQGIPAGSLTIAEDAPPDYDSARVFCNQRKLANEETGEAEVPASNFSASVDLQFGYDMDCDWFNIPGQSNDDSAVMIRKHGCPSIYNATSARFNDLAAKCQDVQADVDFKLEPFDGNPGNQLTDQNGVVTWEHISSGPGKIIETPPSGYVSIRVFCRQYKLTVDDTGFSEYSVTDFTASYDLQPGYNLECDWFNTYSQAAPPVATSTPRPTGPINPTGPTQTPTPSKNQTTLTIVKYTCDPGYDLWAKDADPQNDCPDTTAHVQFRSVGKSTTTSKATDQTGKVVFPNLNSGPHQIVENLPKDTAYAFVLNCTSNLRKFDGYPFFPFAMIGSDGTLGYDILPNEKLTCNWYDVPEASNAAVTITMRWCAGNQASPATCPIYTEGFDFTLSPVTGTGDDVTETTNNQGVASFDVPPGKYTIKEQDDTTWCFIDSDAVDAGGNLVVADEPVEVAISNCGPKP